MTASFSQLMFFLFAGIIIIVVLTTRYKVHAFFALLIASLVVGLGVQLPPAEIITVIKDGFGNVMRSLGFIIVLGTTLGILLEHTNSTKVMAAFILRKVGERRSSLALSITGYVVGLPIFCDSGYIVLNGLNESMAKRTGIPVPVLAVSLATGLYSVHCLTPPHPGISAAAATIGIDLGRLILFGMAVAIPAMIVGHLWAKFAGARHTQTPKEEMMLEENKALLPSVMNSFLPVIIPIVLIAVRSFFVAGAELPYAMQLLLTLGDPVVALSIGILLAFNCKRTWNRKEVGKLLQDAAEKAGGILVIIGAGGAFGAILAATHIGEHFSNALNLSTLGILFPFLLTSLLKTAQGSSTVAVITAASIIQPLLPALGLATGNGPLLAVLAMGAGSMMISHANDAYFWVISKFSLIDMRTMLRVYSVASIFMGLISFIMVWILSLFI